MTFKFVLFPEIVELANKNSGLFLYLSGKPTDVKMHFWFPHSYYVVKFLRALGIAPNQNEFYMWQPGNYEDCARLTFDWSHYNYSRNTLGNRLQQALIQQIKERKQKS